MRYSPVLFRLVSAFIAAGLSLTGVPIPALAQESTVPIFSQEERSDWIPADRLDSFQGPVESLLSWMVALEQARKQSAQRIGGEGEAASSSRLLQAETSPSLDVNRDGVIAPLDILQIANYLNAHEVGPTPAGREALDVNRDGFIIPMDALLMINYLNSDQPGTSAPLGIYFEGSDLIGQDVTFRWQAADSGTEVTAWRWRLQSPDGSFTSWTRQSGIELKLPQMVTPGAYLLELEGQYKAGYWSGTIRHPFIRESASLPSQAASTEENNPGYQSPALSHQFPGAGPEESIEAQTGALLSRIHLPEVRSLGEAQGVELVYKSTTVEPRPILSFDVTHPSQKEAPDSISYQLLVNGVEQSQPIVLNTSSFLPDEEKTFRIAAQFDARFYSTGSYPFELRLENRYEGSSTPSQLPGSVLVDNRVGSSFGAGWDLSGLQRLHLDSAGNAVLTDGGGDILLFQYSPESGYRTPAGEFSTLARNPDDGFTRRLDDGLQIEFNGQGLQTAVVDRSGNRTAYAYERDRLVGVSDPAGRVTSFEYDEQGLLSEIEDAAGRITRFEHNTAGDLTQVLYPDGSSEAFSYDGRHLLVKRYDTREVQRRYEYNAAGRLAEILLPDGTSQKVTNPQEVGLPPLLPTAEAESSSFFFQPADATATFRSDGGAISTVRLDRFGRAISETDPLGRTTLTERDSNGLPVKITQPDDAVTTFSYDDHGHVTERANGTGLLFNGDFERGDFVGWNASALMAKEGERFFSTYGSHSNSLYNVDTTGIVLSGDYAPWFDPFGNLWSPFVVLSSSLSFKALLVDPDPSAERAPSFVTVVIQDPDVSLPSFTDYHEVQANVVRIPPGDLDSPPEVFFSQHTIDTFAHIGQWAQVSFNDYKDNLDVPGRRYFTLIDDVRIGFIEEICEHDSTTGLINSVTDALGNVTLFDYDAVGNLTQITDTLGNAATLEYDSHGWLTTLTDAQGNQAGWSYDPASGNPLSLTDPLERTTSWSYDSAGNLTGAQDPLDRHSSFVYDAMNRLTEVWDPLGSTTQYDYDPAGNLLALSDPLGQSSHFEYDSMDRVTSASNALGQTRDYEYDAGGRLAETTDAKGQQIQFEYDIAGQLVKKVLLDSAGATADAVSYSYDSIGNLMGVQDNDSKLQFAYDQARNLRQASTGEAGNLAVHQPATVLKFSYDQNGNRVFQADPAGTVTYTYDALDRVTQINSFYGAEDEFTASFQYDSLSRRTQFEYSNGIETALTYDAAGQLLSIISESSGMPDPIAQAEYTYDDIGNRMTATDLEGLNTYSYDALDRLASATHSGEGEAVETFSYDAVGNRLSSHLSSAYRYDAANRLLEDDRFIYAYDANGNLEFKTEKATGTVTAYAYDVEDRLIRVTITPLGVTAPSLIASYRYDGLGRRIEKEAGGEITRYVYDGEDIALEYSGDNELLARWLHGPEVDEPLMMERDLDANGTFEEGERFFYHADGLGSIVALTDSAGKVVERYRYDSFGTPTILGPGPDSVMDTADDVSLSQSAYGNPYLFTGREWDSESGLYHYRARAYDPSLGRFLQEDLLGVMGKNNLYTYVVNNPLIFTDPYGLDYWIEGPSGNEPPLHESINVGNPKGIYESYSFGVNGETNPKYGLEGEVYVDPFKGGKIRKGFYIKTTPAEDKLIKAYLDSQVGQKGRYRVLGDNCRNYAETQFRKLLKAGYGQSSRRK